MLITDKVVDATKYRGDLSIESLEFSPEVEEIGYAAFFGCKNLKKVVIPKTVRLVRQGAFASCEKLEDLSFDYSTIFEKQCFDSCFGLKYLHNQGLTARVFSLDSAHAYIVTLYQKSLSTKDCDIYMGRYDNTAGGFPSERADRTQDIIYVAVVKKDGQEYIWFHEDIKIAVTVATFLSSGKSFGEFFHVDVSEELAIDKKQFALLVGGCSASYGLWDFACKACHLDPDEKYQIGLFISIFDGSVPSLINRLRAMIEHKNEPFSFFDIKNTIPYYQVREEFINWYRQQSRE